MEGLIHDLRYALRTLGRRPGFAFVATVSLALGIGGTTALFSALYAVVRRPLPFHEAERLVRVYQVPEGRSTRISLRPETFQALADRARGFESMVAQRATDLVLDTPQGPERIVGIAVSAGWARTLGIQPILGRTFLPAEEQLGEDAGVVLVSHDFWRLRLASGASALGSVLDLGGRPCEVVGVLPAGFRYPYHADVWLPLAVQSGSPRPWAFNVQARLRPGVTLEQAQGDLAVIARDLARERPEGHRGTTLRAVPLREVLVSDEGDQTGALAALLAATGFVLLIVCANLANLHLARAVERRREMVLRLALGAPRARQVRLVLSESIVLGALGGTLGVGLALALRGVMVGLLPEDLLTVLGGLPLDPVALAFCAGLSLLVGLGVGLAAAVHALGADLQEVMAATRATGGRSAGRLVSSFVVSQVALSVVLLTGAGLLARHLSRLQQADLGYEPQGLLTASLSLDAPVYSDAARRIRLVRGVEERLLSAPGVRGAGITNVFPTRTGNTLARVMLEGADPSVPAVINQRVVSPGFLRAVGVPLLRGRLLEESDTLAADRVAVVSRALAARYWPGQDPVGRRLRNARDGADAPLVHVVGVVGDVREFYGVDETWYVPYAQEARTGLAARVTFAVRSAGDPATAVTTLRTAVREADAGLALFNVLGAEMLYADTLAPQRLATQLLGGFAGFGLLVAAVGLYGVLSYAVVRRTHEIGIRMVLGATPRRIFSAVLWRGATLVGLGAALGVAAALALPRLMQRVAGPMAVDSLLPFTGALAVLAAAAFVACAAPARRAARADPVVSLRRE